MRRTLETADSTSLLLVGEVAKRLACSPQTVHRWCKTGKFPKPIFLTNGSQARWSLRSVEAFILKRSVARRPRPELRGALAATPASKRKAMKRGRA